MLLAPLSLHSLITECSEMADSVQNARLERCQRLLAFLCFAGQLCSSSWHSPKQNDKVGKITTNFLERHGDHMPPNPNQGPKISANGTTYVTVAVAVRQSLLHRLRVPVLLNLQRPVVCPCAITKEVAQKRNLSLKAFNDAGRLSPL